MLFAWYSHEYFSVIQIKHWICMKILALKKKQNYKFNYMLIKAAIALIFIVIFFKENLDVSPALM